MASSSRPIRSAKLLNPGEGNGNFLADLAKGETDEVMRQRWTQGHYGTPPPRPDYVKAWRIQAGRDKQEDR